MLFLKSASVDSTERVACFFPVFFFFLILLYTIKETLDCTLADLPIHLRPQHLAWLRRDPGD